MKQIFVLTLILVLSAGCATLNSKPEFVKTVSSDIYPVELSRDQYYEEMARAYSKDFQSQKAVEQFRLSILHNPKRISAHIGLSDEYKKQKLNHLAAFEIEEALKIQPGETQALLRLGDLYLDAKIYSKSKLVFSEALKSDDHLDQALWALFYISKLEKKDAEGEAHLAKINPNESNRLRLLLEKAFLAKRLGKNSEFTFLIKQAYQVQPHSKKVVVEMKNEYLRLGDFDSALVVLTHYAESHDFDVEISESLTDVAVRAENYDLALRELDQQQLWTEDHSALNMKKAHVNFLAGRLNEAEKKYEAALDVNPTLEEAQFYLAQIYLAQNNMTAAKPLLSDLRSSSTFFADAQVRLAYFEVQSDQDEAAVNRLDRAQAQRPDQIVIYKALSDLLLDLHKYDQALQMLEIGISFFPDDEDLQIKAALAYYHQGDAVSFKKSMARALEINPENSEIYTALAELWFLKKLSPKEMERFANKALELKSKSINLKPLLAWALMAQDRSTAAVSLFEKFYEEDPKQPFFAEALAKVYQSADVTMKAQQMNRQALKLQNQQILKSGLILKSDRSPAGTSIP